jgi:hypothetical protein
VCSEHKQAFANVSITSNFVAQHEKYGWALSGQVKLLVTFSIATNETADI